MVGEARRMEWMVVKSRACPSIVSTANFLHSRQRFFLGTIMYGTKKKRKHEKKSVIKKKKFLYRAEIFGTRISIKNVYF